MAIDFYRIDSSLYFHDNDSSDGILFCFVFCNKKKKERKKEQQLMLQRDESERIKKRRNFRHPVPANPSYWGVVSIQLPNDLSSCSIAIFIPLLLLLPPDIFYSLMLQLSCNEGIYKQTFSCVETFFFLFCAFFC